MDDKILIELYWSRSETAVSETERRYGKYCSYIANNILSSKEDAEECVNDVYMALWNSIPPNRPISFSAYLGKITRNLALNMRKAKSRLKRKSEADLVFDELSDILSDKTSDIVDELILKNAVNGFLEGLELKCRIIFLRRYWYMSSIKDISTDYGISEGSVKSILHRTRKRFKEYLVKEGVEL